MKLCNIKDLLENNVREAVGWSWIGQDCWLLELADGIHHTFLITFVCSKFSIIINENIWSIIHHLFDEHQKPKISSKGKCGCSMACELWMAVLLNSTFCLIFFNSHWSFYFLISSISDLLSAAAISSCYCPWACLWWILLLLRLPPNDLLLLICSAERAKKLSVITFFFF